MISIESQGPAASQYVVEVVASEVRQRAVTARLGWIGLRRSKKQTNSLNINRMVDLLLGNEANHLQQIPSMNISIVFTNYIRGISPESLSKW